MKEMLLVGRGGEGVVLASQILADTFARAGFWVQSFPEFKAERRGAPISAFLRWDETSPIHRRYKVRECDVLVVVSPSPPSPEVMRTVRPGGLIVLNRETRFPHAGPFDIARVPASRIAQEQRHPLLGGPADGQRGRARRLREAPRSGRARVPGAGHRVPHGRHGRGEHRCRQRGLRAVHETAHARRRHAGRACARARTGSAATAPASLPGEHDGLASATTPARGRSTGPCSPTNAPPAPCARSSVRKGRSRGATARWSSTTSTARAAASARSCVPFGTRSRWRR